MNKAALKGQRTKLCRRVATAATLESRQSRAKAREIAIRVLNPRNRQNIAGDLDILPLPLVLAYTLCTFMHEQLTRRGPPVLDPNLLGEGRQTRASGVRIVKLARRQSNMGRNSFYVKASKIWNCLPAEIRGTESTTLFKKRLKKHLNQKSNSRLEVF
jgi:hypothetical protein